MEMANRKMRRKTKENYSDQYSQSTKSMIITLVAVLVVFGLFYLMTVVINNKNRKLNTKEPSGDVSIQYQEILGDDTFTMSPTEYYVLFYDFDGVDAGFYEYLFNKYAATEGNYIYKVDLGNGFNKKFVSEETNDDADEAGELKVKEATLIKIKKGKNVDYTEGSKNDISEVLSK